MAPATTLMARTSRLELHWAGEHTDIDALLEVFNSNPQWIEATNDFAGRTCCDRSDVEMFLWQGTMGEGSHCLEIRDGDQGQLVGMLAWVAPHPRDRCPWIGSIVLRADRQHQGLAREVLQALEQRFAAEGWNGFGQARSSPNRVLTRSWSRSATPLSKNASIKTSAGASSWRSG